VPDLVHKVSLSTICVQ